jgi:hypothetical protein
VETDGKVRPYTSIITYALPSSPYTTIITKIVTRIKEQFWENGQQQPFGTSKNAPSLAFLTISGKFYKGKSYVTFQKRMNMVYYNKVIRFIYPLSCVLSKL